MVDTDVWAWTALQMSSCDSELCIVLRRVHGPKEKDELEWLESETTREGVRRRVSGWEHTLQNAVEGFGGTMRIAHMPLHLLDVRTGRRRSLLHVPPDGKHGVTEVAHVLRAGQVVQGQRADGGELRGVGKGCGVPCPIKRGAFSDTRPLVGLVNLDSIPVLI